VLLAGGRRNSGMTSFFLHSVKLLLGVVERLLLLRDLLLVLRVFFIPRGLIAQTISGVGVHGGRAQAVFALGDVQFTGHQADLILLRRDLGLPFIDGFLLVGSRVSRFGSSVRIGRGGGGTSGRLVRGSVADDAQLVIHRQVIVVILLYGSLRFLFFVLTNRTCVVSQRLLRLRHRTRQHASEYCQ